MPRGVTANVGFGGERINSLGESRCHKGDYVVLTTQRLGDAIAELSDLFSDVFHEGCRFQAAGDHTE
jgi:hypothetical protein